MSDVTTSMHAMMARVVDSIVDAVAVDGIAALKKILDEEFKGSETLQDYEVYSHVVGDEITFEILLPAEALDMEDPGTKEAVEQGNKEAEDKAHTPGVRTYGFQPTTRPGRLTGRRDARRDARSRVHDARRDARKAPKTLTSRKKTAQTRLIEHEVALSAPRGMQVNREGKVSLQMTKTVEDTPEGGVRMPQGKFQGVIGKFMADLNKVILDNFAPELEKILQRRLS